MFIYALIKRFFKFDGMFNIFVVKIDIIWLCLYVDEHSSCKELKGNLPCVCKHTATTSLFDACKEHGVIPAAALSAAFLRTVASLNELKEKKQDEFSYTWYAHCLHTICTLLMLYFKALSVFPFSVYLLKDLRVS